MFIAYENKEGYIESFKMDLERRDEAFYLGKFPNGVCVEALPDAEYADCWKIVAGAVVMDEALKAVRVQYDLDSIVI